MNRLQECQERFLNEPLEGANGDNPHHIYYRWWFIPLGDLEERED